MSVNKWFGAGILNFDPEEKTTRSGTKYVSFSIPLYVPVNNKKTYWITCEIWDNQQKKEYVLKHIHKKDYVMVVGALRVDEWEEEGVKRKGIVCRVEDVHRIFKGQQETKINEEQINKWQKLLDEEE